MVHVACEGLSDGTARSVTIWEGIFKKHQLVHQPTSQIISRSITAHLNKLNLKLQGAGQTVLDIHETCEAFIQKLTVFSSDVETSTFRHFKRAFRSVQYQHHGNTWIHPSTRDRIRNAHSIFSAVWTTVFLSNQTRKLYCPAWSVALQLAEYRGHGNAAEWTESSTLGKKVCRTMTAAGNRSCAWSRSLHFHLLGITTRELSQELCTVHIINVWCERSNMQSGCSSPPHQLRSRFSRLQNVHTHGSELAHRCAHFPVKSVFNKSQLLLLKWRTPVSDPVLCVRNVYKWDHYLVFTKYTQVSEVDFYSLIKVVKLRV